MTTSTSADGRLPSGDRTEPPDDATGALDGGARAGEPVARLTDCPK